ncbi:substrate-binding domain-containing protein [Catellatospora sp. IY07-71]|uniref:substrate-binding domain-containing protein n=1 Tax=Catellatospora sp. IY07-71 TaxID=2728827 RepID=UPI001BB3B314|nr:substrate-binding domain-containing protein [Catellatospora sp. IY07-71]
MSAVPGRHRNVRRIHPALSAVAAVFAVALVVSGAFIVYDQLAEPGCSGSASLTVAAPAEIAPALKDTAAALTEQKAAVDGACVAVDVVTADPADVAAAVASLRGLTLTGVGQPNGSTQVPDVWIPDSATWLARVTAASPNTAVQEAPSIARSPVVVAMAEPAAKALGWPTAKLTWQALLQQMTSGTKMRVGIVEPTRDAAGLSGLLALASTANSSPNAQAATTGALRTLAAGRSALRQDVLARFPRSNDPAAVASALGAAPLSEQAVIAYNAAQPPVPLAGLYLEPAPIALDYPYAMMPGIDAKRQAAAGRFLEALREPAFRDRLAKIGLRGPDGSFGAGVTTPTGAPEVATVPAPAASPTAPAATAAVDRVLSTWVAVTLPARMLAVIDVSGSMLTKVPTAGGATRAQITLEASRRGLGLFDDSWAVGLWTFSTELDGAKDYKQQVPIGPLSSQRTRMLQALGSITPKPDGDTGMYDTILAAYQAVQKDWDPGRVNSIVLMTDGDNDDDNGISLEALLAKLKDTADPQRPIQVIILTIGDVKAEPLQKITKVTGGGVFSAKDPAKIGDVFLKAISLRSAQTGS